MRYIDRLGEQVAAAQVGELVTGLFGDERNEIRTVIDRQLKALKGTSESDSDWDRPRRSSIPPLAPAGADDDEETRRSVPPPAVSPSQPPQGTLQAVVRPEEGLSRGRFPLVIAVAGVALLGAAIALAVRGLSAPETSTVELPAATTPAPAAPPPETAAQPPAPPDTGAAPQGSFIRARIAANPSDAKIFVDGSELPSNPFESRFVKDDAAHRIEVKAAGFLPQSRMIVFDKDVELEITLHPQRPGAPPPTAAPSNPGATPPKPDPY
jgi:serine/threonine-protein kinase